MWKTSDGNFNVESDWCPTECQGGKSASGYCPAHGHGCTGDVEVLQWTVWDNETGDHAHGPYPFDNFTDAVNRLKLTYERRLNENSRQ
jgi:hypothetical protein